MIAAYHSQLGLLTCSKMNNKRSFNHAVGPLKSRKQIGSEKMAPDDLAVLAQVYLKSKNDKPKP